MTELLASDAAYSLRDGSTSTYADNGIAVLIYFNISVVHSEKKKKRGNVFRIKHVFESLCLK